MNIKRIGSVLSSSAVALALVVGCGTGTASASGGKSGGATNYPTHSIQIVVPYSAGGGTDTFARAFAKPFQQKVGKSVVVVDKPGASGDVGMTAIAKAKPDGYELGMLGFPDPFLQPAIQKTTYNSSQFQYIAQFTASPTILMVKPGSPFSTLAQFISYAKAHPGKLTLSTSGAAHILTIVELEQAAGIKLTPVKYSGGGKNLNAVIGGHVDAAIIAEQFAKSGIDQGCKVLAVAGPDKLASLPNVPTFKQLGYNVSVLLGRALVAPLGTPAAVIKKLEAICNELNQDPAFKKQIEATGAIYSYKDGSQVETFVKSQAKIMQSLAKKYQSAFSG